MTTIKDLKTLLSREFHMKDLGNLRYFLGIEIDRSPNGIFLCQKKYLTDTIHEFGMTNYRPVHLPLDCHVKLTHEKGDPLPDPSLYQRLVGNLNYFTITRPDICDLCSTAISVYAKSNYYSFSSCQKSVKLFTRHPISRHSLSLFFCCQVNCIL